MFCECFISGVFCGVCKWHLLQVHSGIGLPKSLRKGSPRKLPLGKPTPWKNTFGSEFGVKWSTDLIVCNLWHVSFEHFAGNPQNRFSQEPPPQTEAILPSFTPSSLHDSCSERLATFMCLILWKTAGRRSWCQVDYYCRCHVFCPQVYSSGFSIGFWIYPTRDRLWPVATTTCNRAWLINGWYVRSMFARAQIWNPKMPP